MFSAEEKRYYSRQFLLSEIGVYGQEKLKDARVLVVGAGGLGCPVLSYLAGAGVGIIGIIDSDKVEQSNLQRQVLYGASQEGMYKAEAAETRLKDLNPHIVFNSYCERLTPQNAMSVIADYDIIVDATDNFPTRYLINDACVILDRPFVMGSIDRFQGQVSVLNWKNKDGNYGPTYRCLFPEPPTPETAPNCDQIGVLGVLPGIIGSLQATEVIKMICGIGDVLSGKLLVFDTLKSQSYSYKISRNEEQVNRAGQLKDGLENFDYADFCHEVAAISVEQLKRKLQKKEPVQLWDVRETKEIEFTLPDSESVPMSQLEEKTEKWSLNGKPLVIYCDYGISSKKAAHYIKTKTGSNNIFNLAGGIDAWLKETESQ